MSTSKKECLLKKFERLKAEYVKTFKAGFENLCQKIGDKLFALIKELEAEGVSFSELGLSNDGEYILRSLEMVAKNPMNENADVIFADAKRIKCGLCANRCKEIIEKTLSTMQGFDVYTVDENNQLGIPEPVPEEKAQIPDHPVTRSCDLQKAKKEE